MTEQLNYLRDQIVRGLSENESEKFIEDYALTLKVALYEFIIDRFLVKLLTRVKEKECYSERGRSATQNVINLCLRTIEGEKVLLEEWKRAQIETENISPAAHWAAYGSPAEASRKAARIAYWSAPANDRILAREAEYLTQKNDLLAILKEVESSS